MPRQSTMLVGLAVSVITALAAVSPVDASTQQEKKLRAKVHRLERTVNRLTDDRLSQEQQLLREDELLTVGYEFFASRNPGIPEFGTARNVERQMAADRRQLVQVLIGPPSLISLIPTGYANLRRWIFDPLGQRPDICATGFRSGADWWWEVASTPGDTCSGASAPPGSSAARKKRLRAKIRRLKRKVHRIRAALRTEVNELKDKTSEREAIERAVVTGNSIAAAAWEQSKAAARTQQAAAVSADISNAMAGVDAAGLSFQIATVPAQYRRIRDRILQPIADRPDICATAYVSGADWWWDFEPKVADTC